MKKSDKKECGLLKDLSQDYMPETAVIHRDSRIATNIYTNGGFRLPFKSNDAFRQVAYSLVEVSKHRLIAYRKDLPVDVIKYLASLVDELESATEMEVFKSLAYTISMSFEHEIKDLEEIKKMLAEKRTDDFEDELLKLKDKK